MRKFKIVNKLPERISFIKWDVDGTVTDKDVIPSKILDIIIEFSLKDIVSFFITGRDAAWMERFFIKPLKKKIGRNLLIKSKVAENVFLRPELGLIEINDPMTEKKELLAEVKNHPFLNPQKRKRVAKLFFEKEKILPFKGGRIPNGFEAGKDAADKPFLFPIKNAVPFPDYIWSEYKFAMGTSELRREMDGSCSPERVKRIIPAAKKLKKILKEWGYLNFIDVSPVSTCINLPLKINGLSINKDWTGGQTLIYLSKKFNTSVEEIAKKCLAIGDSKTDFLFSVPRLPKKSCLIPFIFVGPQSQYKPTAKQKKNIIIKSVPPFFGTEVTLEVVKYLKNRFEKFKF